MRLTLEQREAIRQVVAEFDPSARAYLFGSRTDDAARGGDIDLLVFPSSLDGDRKRKLKLALYSRLGAQKIDVVAAADDRDAFVRLIRKKGVEI